MKERKSFSCLKYASEDVRFRFEYETNAINANHGRMNVRKRGKTQKGTTLRAVYSTGKGGDHFVQQTTARVKTEVKCVTRYVSAKDVATLIQV